VAAPAAATAVHGWHDGLFAPGLDGHERRQTPEKTAQATTKPTNRAEILGKNAGPNANTVAVQALSGTPPVAETSDA